MPPEHLKKDIQEKLSLLETLSKNYISVIAVGSPSWGVNSYLKIAEAFGIESPSKEKLIVAIREMRLTLGIKGTIDLAVKSEEIYKLSEFALMDPCMVTNPVAMTNEDVIKVLERGLKYDS